MFRSPLHVALRAWYAFRMLRLRSRPRPSDVPAVRSGDPAADRILVVGNGPSAGWGVTTHQLSLVGQLAPALAARTGRACDADLVGADAMNAASALAWVGDRDLDTVDAVITTVGFNDALRLTPVSRFRTEVRDYVDGIVPRLHPDAVVALVGVPPIRSFRAYDGVVARLTEAHRERLNGVLREVAAERGVAYVELPWYARRRHTGAMAVVYGEFASRIADELAPLLIESRPDPQSRGAQRDRTWQWSGTGKVVELARDGGAPELRRLAEQAQKAFHVELAVVSLVDGDRLYYANNTDVMPESVPYELSFCKHTVEQGAPLIIPDTGKDPRFRTNPLVDVSFINFYAGYPIHGSDGSIIGSFCLQGSRTRAEASVSLERLRALAAEAEGVLQGFESGAPTTVVPATPTASPAPRGPRYEVG